MNKDNWGNCLVFFLMGAATGAAVALLYAPQEGEATRRMIGDKAGEYRDKASEMSSTVAQTVKDKYNTVADKVQGYVSRGQDGANSAIDKVADKAHAGVNSVN